MLDRAAQVFADVAGAVIAHDPLHLDAVLGEALECVLEESYGVAAGLCGAQLRDGVARVVVDCQMQVTPAGLAIAPARVLAESSLTDLPEATQLLDIQMNELAGSGVLVPVGQRPRCRRSTRDAMTAQHPPDRRSRPAQHASQTLRAPAGRSSQLHDLLLSRVTEAGWMGSGDRRAVTQRLPASLAIARQSAVGRGATHAAHDRRLRRRKTIQHQAHQPATRLPRVTHPTRRITLNHPGLRRVVDSQQAQDSREARTSTVSKARRSYS